MVFSENISAKNISIKNILPKLYCPKCADTQERKMECSLIFGNCHHVTDRQDDFGPQKKKDIFRR